MDRIRSLFSAHPTPASNAGSQAFDLVRATAECAAVCIACADACLEEENVVELRKCIRLNQDCADMCAVTGRLVSRPGHQDPDALRAQIDACATICRACAAECEEHAAEMEHCRICAEACRACAEACEQMLGAVVA